jgi:hypothetical protein
MVRTLCTSGKHEMLKTGVHGAAGVLAAACAAYNFTAWYLRREERLRINAVVYFLAVAWELKQTVHHINHLNPAVDDADLTARKCA